MKNKKLTIGSLSASLLLGLAVTSFAGMSLPGNSPNIEIGVAIVASDKAKAAAANFNFTDAQLAQIGTELGAEVIASDKAKIAAANFDYDTIPLAWVGAEEGYDPTRLSTNRGFFSAGSASEQVSEKCINESRFSQVC